MNWSHLLMQIMCAFRNFSSQILYISCLLNERMMLCLPNFIDWCARIYWLMMKSSSYIKSWWPMAKRLVLARVKKYFQQENNFLQRVESLCSKILKVCTLQQPGENAIQHCFVVIRPFESCDSSSWAVSRQSWTIADFSLFH